MKKIVHFGPKLSYLEQNVLFHQKWIWSFSVILVIFDRRWMANLILILLKFLLVKLNNFHHVQFYVKKFEYYENFSSHVTSYLGEFLGRVLKWEKIRSSFRPEGSHGKLGTRLHKYFLHFYKTKKTPKLHKIIYFNERWHFDSSKHSNLILESGYNAIGQKWHSSQKYTILDRFIPF